MANILESILSGNPPQSFALLRREGNDKIDLLVGNVVDVDLIDEIPLASAEGPRDVLALVPFNQIRERGYDAHQDAARLRCLVVSNRESVSIADFLSVVPDSRVDMTNGGFRTSDEEYADIVSRIITNEIGRGEGANFVIRRDYEAHCASSPEVAIVQWFRELLVHEEGAYWTFGIRTPGLSMAGASPERHVSSQSDGPAGRVVRMNPISGTYRHPLAGPDADSVRKFLLDTKETEELFMVVDEEMKMMSKICSAGGRILGPFLKQMAALTHTEYTLEGHTDLRSLDVLRESMFAATVTGSPMQNACAVIRRYEKSGRGYYGGAIAFLESESGGGHSLDSPILIRTAYLDDYNNVLVPVGATLVRNSEPESEVAETWAKAGGILSAIGAQPRRVKRDVSLRVSEFEGVEALLTSRNDSLSTFWMSEQMKVGRPRFAGRSAVVIDAEDDFSSMLAHSLRSFGLDVKITPWRMAQERIDADIVIAGPGPGDPTNLDDPRIAQMHRVIEQCLQRSQPLLAVCLSHQILCLQLGFPVERLDSPNQGRTMDVTGQDGPETIGFYNTYSAMSPAASSVAPRVRIIRGEDERQILMASGRGFASTQGHLESVLSLGGQNLLEILLEHLLEAESPIATTDSTLN